MIWQTVGAGSMDELVDNWNKYEALSLECSVLSHVTKDGPPVYLKYTVSTDPPVIKGDGIHHAHFGYMLKEKCDQIGTECTFDVVGGEKPEFSSGEFLRRIFSE